MTHHEQRKINKSVESACTAAFDGYVPNDVISRKRLRTCKAEVVETSRWFILWSYSTIVAAVDKETGIGYDFLRLVYGFSATSAQHIAKFFRDYGIRGTGGSGLEMRWYPL